MDYKNNSYALIDEILNSSDIKSDDLYVDILKKISNVYKDIKNKSLAIYFLENSQTLLKVAINNKKEVKNYKLKNSYVEKLISNKNKYFLLNSTKDELLYTNTIIIKLAIKDSVYGCFVFSCDTKFDNVLISELVAISASISYKIKDYELNEVFKIQLKAMQDAVVEKEAAYSVIAKQHKKLQELDKTKNLFLANISHELRTPLNAIIGFSQALGSKIFGELNPKQDEYVKDIQISGLHLLCMINEILDISKLEANAMKFSPSEINASQTIQEVVNILEPLYKNKNIIIEFNSLYQDKIIADYHKFQQILYNLLSNAIKFTPDKGLIKIDSYTKNNKYYLTVSDNGIGIDKKNHNKIFKKFVHLNNVYKKNQSSTGLGLTITKELVKLHNGTIKLESKLGKGAKFIMEFKNILV